ncbi:MAG TPA: cyanophycin synthetase, partial [Firmicutes bacterium]|nr:cyanophycin synthetase [Bacillota bacterium]
MEIKGLKAFPGRNIYSHNPVLRVEIDLMEWGQVDSRQLPAFQERLLNFLPGLREHHCSLGKKGGFVERLREGTFLGHIIEHVLLEMQHQLGSEANYGKTRTLANGRVEIIFEYSNKETAVFLAQEVVKSIEALLTGKHADLKRIMDRAAGIMAGNSP